MVVAFAITATFMFALRPVAKSVGLVDRPGGRKSHVGDVPIVGGLAMFLGVFGGLMLIGDASLHLPSLVTASLILVVIGAVDDKYSLPASVRVAAQIGAVLIMVYGAGLSVISLGNPLALGDIELGGVELIVTIVISLTVVNAYNMIDGADGLAGSLAIIALIAISFIGGFESTSTHIALTIIAAIIGFLVFNFPVTWNRQIRAFMGDAGSTFLGFTIVWVTIGASQGPHQIASPVYCLWFVSIPVYDLLTCFVRRLMAGKSPFTPGRDHFHHSLLRGGLGLRQVLGLMTGVQALYALVALAALGMGIPEPVMFFAWSVLGLTQHTIFKSIGRYVRLRKIRGRSKSAHAAG